MVQDVHAAVREIAQRDRAPAQASMRSAICFVYLWYVVSLCVHGKIVPTSRAAADKCDPIICPNTCPSSPSESKHLPSSSTARRKQVAPVDGARVLSQALACKVLKCYV